MKNLPFHHNEKGSAILITLGILTLVLVLALVFVATSQNARTIAMAGADQGKADLLAESAAARAQAAAYYMQTISSQYPTNNGTNDLKYGTANGAALDALPYLGNFLSASNLDAKALDLTDNANRGIQTILYTHDPNNNNNVDASPYALMTSTQYGAYLLTGADGVNGLAKLDTTSDRWTYRNVLYQETINGTQVDLVKSRYAYLMLSEGGKFDINQMVLAGGTNVIPEVQSGSLAAPDDCNPTQFKDPANTPTYDSLNNLNNPPNSFENPNNIFCSIACYKYNSYGEITGLNDIGGSD